MHDRSPYPATRRSRLAATLALGLLAGCAYLRSPSVPMASTLDAAPAAATSRVLLVILPGVGDTPDDLIRHGMVQMVRERGIAADVVIADAHFGYYRSRQTVQRLWQDVIAPARASGYAGVWLAGISIGGLGAMLYGSGVESDAPDPIAGVLSIAPYLGDAALRDEIVAAGGLLAWQPPAEPEDFARRLFAWLRGYGDPTAKRPPLYLGIGTDDKFFGHAELLAPLLPADHVITVAGAHRWRPWLEIWGEMLDRAPLPRLAARPAADAIATAATAAP
ncbi:MAG: alpha/beta hydrolase [Planctomycetes bacterium]|nr:alpha/beta hydrolase [Planctomycetota bacterium]